MFSLLAGVSHFLQLHLHSCLFFACSCFNHLLMSSLTTSIHHFLDLPFFLPSTIIVIVITGAFSLFIRSMCPNDLTVFDFPKISPMIKTPIISGINSIVILSFSAGIGKLRPAGQIRPTKVFHPACRALFKNTYTDFSHRWIELYRERTVSGFYLVHLVAQRGLTMGTRNNFAQALSITSSSTMILGRK